MKTTKIGLLSVAALLGVSAFVGVALADEVYTYVDVNGNLQTEVADGPFEAIADAEDIAPHSGVILTSELGDDDVMLGNGQEVYGYVDIYGNLQTELASTPQEALLEADNKMPHTGVILMSEFSDL